MSESRQIHRTSDGIPKYDGTPELLALYREEALQYLMAFETRKRYLAGPRLLKELEGTAKVAVRTKTLRDPQWLAHPRGVFVLLDHLEEVLAKPSLLEASRFVMKFFYGMQRRKMETMTAWIARHAEALWEASQALRKVQREYGSKAEALTKSSHGGSQSQWDYGSNKAESRAHESPFREDGRLYEDEDDEEADHHGWDWERQSWRDGDWSHYSWNSWRSKEYEVPESWDISSEIFIPEFLAGFLLLHRAGLDAHERANVLAAIRGVFSTETVGKALREQWSDEDLLRRDRSRAASAMMAEDEISDEEAWMADETFGGLENLNAEEKEAYFQEQVRVDEALEAIRAQKTTLREARWKQKQLRLGRGFYPPKPFQKGSGKGGGDRRRAGCFRCGGDHLIKDCPQKPAQANLARTEAAEIAFLAEIEEEDQTEACMAGMSLEEAHVGSRIVDQCMGIIDSGATASLGSADALQQVMEANLERFGDSKMEIDTQTKPIFKFGNGEKKVCISTVKLGIGAGEKDGSMEVHVHDAPGQPVLISRKALRSLGAVIDFEEKKAIYKRIDPKKVVQLQEAENGHLLMPLVGNIVDNSEMRERDFVSLSSE